MSIRRVALIGSWPQRYIDDHRRWLDQHGAHAHGWSNKLSPANRTLVETTIGAHGQVNFYAYMSLGQGGDGTFDTGSPSTTSNTTGPECRSSTSTAITAALSHRPPC